MSLSQQYTALTYSFSYLEPVCCSILENHKQSENVKKKKNVSYTGGTCLCHVWFMQRELNLGRQFRPDKRGPDGSLNNLEIYLCNMGCNWWSGGMSWHHVYVFVLGKQVEKQCQGLIRR